MVEAETIAAIATSVGEASIGVVRVSGPASVKIARAVFRNSKNERICKFVARKMNYGKMIEPETGSLIDEVLCFYMPAPHSYTGEDVFEFQTHGSSVVLHKALQVLLRTGARLAMPGEFTQRAFLNGRIDLSQAEAVMDIIRAKNDAALKNATGHLSGVLSAKIQAIRKEILDFLASVEAKLDYPEEDIEGLDIPQAEKLLLASIQAIDNLLSTAQVGRILREGISTVIVGRPNVGKSSLLNTLLGENRALVTEIPGTTRDSIEEYLTVRGIPLRLVDTAGLRTSDDYIEKLGMQRTRDYLNSAGLVLFLLDASQSLTDEDLAILQCLPSVPVIIIVNKIDLPQLIELKQWESFIGSYRVVALSAKDRKGFAALEQAIQEVVFMGETQGLEASCVANVRHIERLKCAKVQILSGVTALQAGLPVDCMVIDLRSALESLGQITGETVSDEVVREIFAKFCLGK